MPRKQRFKPSRNAKSAPPAPSQDEHALPELEIGHAAPAAKDSRLTSTSPVHGRAAVIE